uniref:Uncharacterized protein n=1 Tax=Lactuca sativa TaxID=4236 RepID=A0A9R1WD30_LACSA|nr:hypothetical protein LSAT_V11C200092300 [Lactuca sativa]
MSCRMYVLSNDSECEHVLGDSVTTYSVFWKGFEASDGFRDMLSVSEYCDGDLTEPILDGHNGAATAIYTKDNLLNNVLSAIPADLNRE